MEPSKFENPQKIFVNITTAGKYFVGISVEIDPNMPDDVAYIVDSSGNTRCITGIVREDKVLFNGPK